MSIVNIMCSICTEVFKNSDDVHSTSCGHIFHLYCLSTWQARQKNCPQCRYNNPSTHKLHLTFDETEEISEIDDDIVIKLTSANDKIVELQDQMKEQKGQFLQLQKQFTITEQSNLKLEEKISTIVDMESDFMQLQAQYTESSELRKELEDQINQLFVRNECKAHELKNKILENESIKANMDSKHLSGGIHNDKIKLLEQKIKHMLEDFEKEIKWNTQLSTENMLLQNRVNNLQKPLKIMKNDSLTNNCKINIAKNTVDRKNKMATQDKFQANVIENCESVKTNATAIAEEANTVLIKQFPLEQLTVPLENVVILLASKMNFHISTDDLIEVNLVSSGNKNSTKLQVFVEFKSAELKNRFLLESNILKNNPIYKSISIEDFHGLFLYAQKSLQIYGYNVFYKKQKIFAKNDAIREEVLHIQSKTQVDRIKNNLMGINGIST